MDTSLRTVISGHLGTASALAVLSLLGACAQTGAPIVADAGTTAAPILGPYQHIPAPRWREPDPATTIKRTGDDLKVETHYREGRYAETASEGLVLLEKGKPDDELKLYIANSLAWTGRLSRALTIYQTLQSGSQRAGANLGIANIHRWQGQAHLAVPLYKSILKDSPKDEDAIEGLRLAMREIKPRTTVRWGGTHDSSDINSRQLTLNHRWRDESLANIWEVESALYRIYDPSISERGNDVTVRYRALEKPYKPRAELGTNGQTVFGMAGIELEPIPLKLELGRVNWGRIANNPRGLDAGLTALRLGAQITQPTDFGSIFANAEFNRISDGNTVNAGTVRFTPQLQPLGSHFKIFAGAEARKATFNTSSYWSPADGYGSAFVGVNSEWSGPDWELNVAAQVGARLFGEAGRSWAGTLSAKRWIGDNWAVGINAWSMSNRRDSLPYRAQSVFVTLEKLWD